MSTSVEEQLKIIAKGTHDIISKEELKGKLIKAEKENKPLIIKLGLDPSAPDIHLGHAVVLRKIKQMQDLGHRAVIVIGDFTGKIGDPTGKSKTRVPLTDQQVLDNALTYKEQIFKVLDRDNTEVMFNSKWLSKLNFENVLKLAATTTVARILERDDFSNRFHNNIPIGAHEFFYPLMQGYDSVEIQADIELGGTDQTFNILMGRTLQKNANMEQQIAIFMPILEGLDGVEKMSKSLGNYIGVNESSQVMFKKVMEIPDSLIIKYFELATDDHPDKIDECKKRLEAGENPKNIKLQLAKSITRLYHTEEDTRFAAEYFETVFTNKNLPDIMPELIISNINDKLMDIVSLLIENKYVTSKSEFRRLASQGGIKINQESVEDLSRVLISGDIIRIGKKKFLKVIKNY